MSDVLVEWQRNVMGWERGDRVRLSWSGEVEKLVENGLVTVVEDYAPVPPARNAGRDKWVEFLESRGFEVDGRMSRRRLIDMWDGRV